MWVWSDWALQLSARTAPTAGKRTSVLRELERLVLQSVPLIIGGWVLLGNVWCRVADVVLLTMGFAALLESGNALVSDRPLAILFEICSAFGGVGLSLGYPNTVLSFAGAFTIAGKLLIMVFMTISSHRDLPLNMEPSVPQLGKLSRHTHVHAIVAPSVSARKFITRVSAF